MDAEELDRYSQISCVTDISCCCNFPFVRHIFSVSISCPLSDAGGVFVNSSMTCTDRRDRASITILPSLTEQQSDWAFSRAVFSRRGHTGLVGYVKTQTIFNINTLQQVSSVCPAELKQHEFTFISASVVLVQMVRMRTCCSPAKSSKSVCFNQYCEADNDQALLIQLHNQSLTFQQWMLYPCPSNHQNITLLIFATCFRGFWESLDKTFVIPEALVCFICLWKSLPAVAFMVIIVTFRNVT